MKLLFNSILTAAGLNLADVRLIRHTDKKRSAMGRTPYELWRDNRSQFELYQSTQRIKNRVKLRALYWAVFIGPSSEETMFVGLYSVAYRGLLQEDTPSPTTGEIDKAGSCDVYELTLLDDFNDFIGTLFIDWGPSKIVWVQYPQRQCKSITELHSHFQEPSFPGYLNFIQSLSKLGGIPPDWISALRSSRGVYLLTCPKTKEQYVGSAKSESGFWGRWQDYIQTGHGGNEGLKSREPSDYQISILEVAGTSATSEEIGFMEGRWQRKLQSQEMGLNRNLAART